MNLGLIADQEFTADSVNVLGKIEFIGKRAIQIRIAIVSVNQAVIILVKIRRLQS